jgi:KaiC/GvpD/RAD55 family RecA-like ATPase
LIQGYPKGKTILVSGEPGVGKTILGLQFLNACCKEGKKCLYLATEERPEDLKAQAMSFGWDLAEYEESGVLEIRNVLEQLVEKETGGVSVHEIERAYHNMINVITQSSKGSGLPFIPVAGTQKKLMTDVVILDNIGSLAIGMPPSRIRKVLNLVIAKLVELERTAFIISDEAMIKMTNNVMMYTVYGAIRLMKRDNPYINKRERVMDIIKIRNTKIPLDYLLFTITDKGIELMNKS